MISRILGERFLQWRKKMYFYHMGEWQPIWTQNNDFITLVLGMNFLVFVSLKVRFQNTFFSFIRLIDTRVFFSKYGDQSILKSGWTYGSGFFTLSTLSLFVALVSDNQLNGSSIEKIYFIILLGGVFIIFLRTLLSTFIGLITGQIHWINQSHFRALTYIFRLSILLYILLLFQVFTFDHNDISLLAICVLFAVLYCLVQLLLLRQIFNQLILNGLYIILYICTLKLSPWLFLLSGLKIYLE